MRKNKKNHLKIHHQRRLISSSDVQKFHPEILLSKIKRKDEIIANTHYDFFQKKRRKRIYDR